MLRYGSRSYNFYELKKEKIAFSVSYGRPQIAFLNKFSSNGAVFFRTIDGLLRYGTVRQKIWIKTDSLMYYVKQLKQREPYSRPYFQFIRFTQVVLCRPFAVKNCFGTQRFTLNCAFITKYMQSIMQSCNRMKF